MLSPLRLLAAVVALLYLADASALAASAHDAPHHHLVQRAADKVSKLSLARQAASVRSAGRKLSGKYYLQNVGTSQYLWYTHQPQTIMLSSKKSVMQLSQFKVGTRISPVESNSKCFAAQWGSQGFDWAVVMYACRNGGPTTDATGGHPQAKQQWHFVPVSGRSNTYYIVPEDHLDDELPRAIATQTLRTFGGYRSTALDSHKQGNKSQMWKLIPAHGK